MFIDCGWCISATHSRTGCPHISIISYVIASSHRGTAGEVGDMIPNPFGGRATLHSAPKSSSLIWITLTVKHFATATIYFVSDDINIRLHWNRHLSDVQQSVTGRSRFLDPRPRVWNTLPEEITTSQTLSTFRRQLKTWLFRKSYVHIRTLSSESVFFMHFTFTIQLEVALLFRQLIDWLIDWDKILTIEV